jgi:glycosyltransferase involved in cell wall biosynthesis
MLCQSRNRGESFLKNILFVIDSLTSGGAEKSLISLLTLFDYTNYKVDLLMFEADGLYLPLLPKEVKVLEVPKFMQRQVRGVRSLIKNKHFKDLYIRIRGSISLRNPYQTKRMHGAQISWRWMSIGIERMIGKYDVAIAYSQGTPTYFVTEKVEADKKLCWINTDYKIAPYNAKFDTKYYEQYDNVVAVSDYNREVFIQEMPVAREKTSVVYDIVSPSLIQSMSEHEGGFDDDFDGLRILTIGRLVDEKGYDLAIKACSKLVQQGYKLKWFVIGEGSLKDKMEKWIIDYHLEDTFILLGTFPNPYVYLKQCEIYVQPSRFEGYGLAIAEARILCKPIVATNFTVVYNQIRDRENGLVVEMNAEGICNGIKEIISNQTLRDQIKNKLMQDIAGTEKEINKIYSIIEA